MSFVEHVLAFNKTAEIEGLGDAVAQGEYLNRILRDHLSANTALFLPREHAEFNDSFRQLIPYVVVMNNRGEVLTYRRGNASGEERLRARRSVGWGGHINLSDVELAGGALDVRATITNAARRELTEELGTADYFERKFVGVIAEKRGVGAVHLAWVEVWRFEDEPTGGGDVAVEALEWHDPSEVLDKYADLMESWSRLALQLVQG